MKTISVSGGYSQNAGNIVINLTDVDGRVVTSGTHSVTIPHQDNLFLYARGGNGQNGLVAADGNKGKDGSAGRDATEFCFGSNGEAGGDGGHGAAGTHGEPAGNGGTVVVHVDDKDLALLDLIKTIDVQAGIPGKAGTHGKGGAGGRGGRGGASHSWTTSYSTYRTEYYNEPSYVTYEQRIVHYLDSNGCNQTRVESIPTHHHGQTRSRQIEDVHYTHHSNPGGLDGSDGRNGGEYLYPLNPGTKGMDGSVFFNIMKNGQPSATHSSKYDLSLDAKEFSSDEASGVFEPGDTVRVSYAIQNTAQTMNSPLEPIPLEIENVEGLRILQQGEVAGNIAAGETHQSSKPIVFKIDAPINYSGSSAYSQTLPITVTARNIRLDRCYSGTYHRKNLRVRYPVQLEDGPTQFLIADNESQILKSSVRNSSQKTIGLNSGRELFIEIIPKETGVADNPSAKSIAVNQLKPDESYQITQKVAFSKEARWGDVMHYSANLYLQPIDRSKKATLIQSQPLQVQLTPRYQADQSNGFLLVINSETSQEALNYWFTTLQQIAPNERVAVWNTSYYGHLNLDNSSSLMKDTSHGTIVVLNNSFKYNASQPTQLNSNFIKETYYKSNRVNDVSLLVVGEKALIPSDLVPQVIDDSQLDNSAMPYYSVDELMKHLLADKEQFNQLGESKIYQLIPTSSEDLYKARYHLQDILTNTFKNRRYQVAVCDSKGIITVQRLADSFNNKVEHWYLNDQQLKTPLNSDRENQNKLIDVLPFSQKLRLFTHMGSSYHRQLAHSIEKELIAEHTLLLESDPYGNWWQRLMRTFQYPFNDELVKLNHLLDCLKQLSVESDVETLLSWSPLVIRLIAQVQLHVEQHSTFWTRFAHFFVPQVNEHLKETIDICSKELLEAQSKLTNSSLEHLHQKLENKKQLLVIEEKLREFLKSASFKSSTFFAPKDVSGEELNAARQLLKVCTSEATFSSLNVYLDILDHSEVLKPFWKVIEANWNDSIKSTTIEKSMVC